MSIQKGDFIEINYTGRLAENDSLFDTTDETEAKKAGLVHDHSHESAEEHKKHAHHTHHVYKPVVICVGERQILPGLENSLVGKEVGKYKIELNAEQAFGKKDTKLLKLLPMTLFAAQKIKPVPGLELNIDNQLGTVKSVSSGRVIVDFNHPLSGRGIYYDVEIKRKITDQKEKVESILKSMGMMPKDGIELKGNSCTVKLSQKIPEQYIKILEEDMKRLTGVIVKLESAEVKN